MRSEWFWNKMAGGWDKPGVNLGEKDKLLVAKTREFLNADSVILDCGCATGSICIELAGQCKAIQGIDISYKMIEIAKRKAAERQIKNLSFAVGSLFGESLEEGSFDAVLVLSTLHLLPDSARVIERINRLLKPGGYFISATPCLGEKRTVSLMVNLPVFLLSRVGILPLVQFFSAAGLSRLVTKSNFKIIQNQTLAMRPITEICIVARKA